MVGVFDSGVGGHNSLRELRRICDRVDAVYLADYKNAPYGTKTKKELIPIISDNVKMLLSLGCERVLIACCTASAMLDDLTPELRERSAGVILPTLDEVRRSGARRVAVIATERTVDEGAFSALSDVCELVQIKAQPLVSIVERGNTDSPYVGLLINRIKELSLDGLILGCTHFSHLLERFSGELSGVRIFSPAHIGAREFCKTVNNFGEGRIKYI